VKGPKARGTTTPGLGPRGGGCAPPLRQADGCVVCALEVSWYRGEGPQRCWSTRPVAYRAWGAKRWVIDWSELEAVRHRRRRAGMAWDWEDELLTDEDADLLDVMRISHKVRRRGQIGRLAERLLGEFRMCTGLVDEGWVVPVEVVGSRREYQVLIGHGLHGRSVPGRFTDITKAREAALAAIDKQRSVLAAALASRGGLALELAAGRALWPAPTVHLVPLPVSRATPSG